MKPNITDIPMDQLPAVAHALGLKPYVVSQLITWLYKKRVSSFEDMTNLSKEARRVLSEHYSISRLKIDRIQQAADGTKKFMFVLSDGKKVESVLIPAADKRLTLCISTQVGCAMGCVFCRTAQMGFIRDLTQGEIVGQLIEVQKTMGHPHPLPPPSPARRSLGVGGRGRAGERGILQITNIVLMGMGEPLVNYDAVAAATKILLDERAFNFSKRRVTISTSGLLPQLARFAKQFDIKIAISLNATTDEVRNHLMPINRRYCLADIMKFCRSYSNQSKHRVTFEYVMIQGVNDASHDMKRLMKLLAGIRAKVNLIPFNPFPGCDYKGPIESTLHMWYKFLTEHGIQTNIRISRGQDILAACGQLAA
jgi:23S rRNA (adenine2503-C2)-methyltransferase